MRSETSKLRTQGQFLTIIGLAVLLSLALGFLWSEHPRMIDSYYRDTAPLEFIEGFGFFALFSLILTVAALLISHDQELHAMLWVGWVLVPPAWFVIEYYYIWPVHGIEEQFGQFQYAQAVAGKLWAAGVAVTSAIFFRDKLAKRLRGDAPPQDPGAGKAPPAGGRPGDSQAAASADSGA